MMWSDSIREEKLKEYVQHTQSVIAKSYLRNYELSLHHKRQEDDLMRQNSSRKRLKAGCPQGRDEIDPFSS